MEKWSNLLSIQTLGEAMSLAKKAQAARGSGLTVYPPQSQIFHALTLTPPEKVKVVIVGQDPYHGPGQANGLAFSVSPGVPIPPSLRNIFREMHADIGAKIPDSGDLTRWAEQGVLLLNTVLTVQEGMPNSHKDWGWQKFVLEVFRICVTLPQPCVFLLWGRQAQSLFQDSPLTSCQIRESFVAAIPVRWGQGRGVLRFQRSWDRNHSLGQIIS